MEGKEVLDYEYISLGSTIDFIGLDSFIPRLLGSFNGVGSWVCFFSWWWLSEGDERLNL